MIYDLGGHCLEVTSSSDELGERFDRLYGPLRAATNAPAPFRLDLAEGHLPEPPPELPLVSQHSLPGEGECRFYASERETFLVFPGSCTLAIDRHTRRSRITIVPGQEERIGGTAGVLAIEAAADDAGQAMLHAACLTLPGEQRCVLIHAPSGTGKTTTALALLGAGYGLCSDDAALVGEGANGLAAWGFPSDPKVHRNTLALMPWLAPALAGEWNEEDEQQVPRAALAGLGRVEDGRPRPVAGLFRLARRAGEQTEVVPLGRADVLASLTADNVRVGLTGVLPLQQRRFVMLARLAAAVPVHEVRVGGDLAGLGEAIGRALAGARCLPPG